jgi:hypothetical protein
VEVSPISARDAPEIERAIAAFARTAASTISLTLSLLSWDRQTSTSVANFGRRCPRHRPDDSTEAQHHQREQAFTELLHGWADRAPP